MGRKVGKYEERERASGQDKGESRGWYCRCTSRKDNAFGLTVEIPARILPLWIDDFY